MTPIFLLLKFLFFYHVSFSRFWFSLIFFSFQVDLFFFLSLHGCVYYSAFSLVVFIYSFSFSRAHIFIPMVCLLASPSFTFTAASFTRLPHSSPVSAFTLNFSGCPLAASTFLSLILTFSGRLEERDESRRDMMLGMNGKITSI